MIPLRVHKKKGLDRQADGQQSDPIRILFFFLLKYGTLKITDGLTSEKDALATTFRPAV